MITSIRTILDTEEEARLIIETARERARRTISEAVREKEDVLRAHKQDLAQQRKEALLHAEDEGKRAEEKASVAGAREKKELVERAETHEAKAVQTILHNLTSHE